MSCEKKNNIRGRSSELWLKERGRTWDETLKGRCVSDRQKKGRQGGKKRPGHGRVDKLNFRAWRYFGAGQTAWEYKVGEKREKEKLDSCVAAIAVGLNGPPFFSPHPPHFVPFVLISMFWHHWSPHFAFLLISCYSRGLSLAFGLSNLVLPDLFEDCWLQSLWLATASAVPSSLPLPLGLVVIPYSTGRPLCYWLTLDLRTVHNAYVIFSQTPICAICSLNQTMGLYINS